MHRSHQLAIFCTLFGRLLQFCNAAQNVNPQMEPAPQYRFIYDDSLQTQIEPDCIGLDFMTVDNLKKMAWAVPEADRCFFYGRRQHQLAGASPQQQGLSQDAACFAVGNDGTTIWDMWPDQVTPFDFYCHEYPDGLYHGWLRCICDPTNTDPNYNANTYFQRMSQAVAELNTGNTAYVYTDDATLAPQQQGILWDIEMPRLTGGGYGLTGTGFTNPLIAFLYIVDPYGRSRLLWSRTRFATNKKTCSPKRKRMLLRKERRQGDNDFDRRSGGLSHPYSYGATCGLLDMERSAVEDAYPDLW